MRNKIWMITVFAAFSAVLSGCVPVALGAAGAVIVDESIERNEGGDGLF